MKGRCSKCKSYKRLYECGDCHRSFCYFCLSKHRCGFNFWVLLIGLFLFLVTIDSSLAITNETLVSCLNLDTNFNDSFRGTYNASVVGTVTINQSIEKLGSGAAQLHGVATSYINWGNIPLTITNLTVNLWVRKPTKYGSDGARQPFFNRGGAPFANPLHLNMLDSGDADRFQSLVGNGGSHTSLASTNAFDFSLNAWHMITYKTALRNAGQTNYFLYLDNVLNNTWNHSQALADDVSDPLSIGGLIGGAWGWGRYLVDDISIFSSNLTPNEISDLYNAGDGFACPFVNTTIPPSLVLNWNLAGFYNSDFLTIGYNGSFTGSYTGTILNCSFSVDSLLNRTFNNVNLSVTNYFNYTLPVLENVTLSLNLSCRNVEVSDDVVGDVLVDNLLRKVYILLSDFNDDMALGLSHLALIFLYMFLTGLSVYLLTKTASVIAGYAVLFMTLGIDFYLITWLYDTFNVVSSTWQGGMIYIFSLFILAWIFFKLSFVFSIKGIRKV